MANINRLLSKKGWTGEEVGKALIASLLNDIKNQGREYEPLFSQEDFSRMEDSLKTERDFTAYGVYRDIYGSIVDHYNKANALHQQFYNGYYRYMMYLSQAMNADQALKTAEQYPLIMTAEQYKQAEREARESLKAMGVEYYTLLFNLLEDFLNALDAGKTKAVPAQIRKAIAATKKEPASGHEIYSSYNELMNEGYYTLPDGRRSDEMTRDEWQQALTDLYLKTHKLTLDGQPATAEQTLEHYNQERLKMLWKLFFKGVGAINQVLADAGEEEAQADPEQEAELMAEFERVIDGEARASSPLISGLYKALEYETPTKWHIYPEPPADLTAYDLLDIIIDSSRYGTTDEKKHLKTFKKEYPALFTALDEYIRECIPKAQGLKPTQLYKPFTTCGELAELGIGKYKETIEVGDAEILYYLQAKGLKFADRIRGSLRGIAVIQHPHSYQIDENGNYIEGKNPLEHIGSLDDLAGDKALDLYALRDDLFIPALSYIYAYNALVDILGAVYDIEGIEAAKLSSAQFESQIEGFNDLLYMFYFDVYGDKEEKARKRKLIKELFAPLDIESIKPTADAIETVTEKLSKLGISSSARKALKDMDALIADLDNREGAC